MAGLIAKKNQAKLAEKIHKSTHCNIYLFYLVLSYFTFLKKDFVSIAYDSIYILAIFYL